jgi:hypothetical protein
MLKRAGRLLLELLVVFVGVYAAFALNTWREDRRDDARREQILQTLRSHVTWVDRGIEEGRPAIDSVFILPFLTRLEDGDAPVLQPIDFAAGAVGKGLWEAMLQAGGLDVLDAATIERMHHYFSTLEQGVHVLDDARAQSHVQLYPNLGRGTDEFYDERGRLRPRYAWYPKTLRTLHHHFQRLDAAGDSTLAHLDSLLDAR